MIIIGDEFIPYERIEKVEKISHIKLTSPNSTLYFPFSKEMLLFCMENSLACAVNISSIKEAVYANALGAKYILPSREILQAVQKLAENYLFDSKVLALIENEDEIEDLALKNIDGAVFQKIIK
jgi:hypothetical protein